jgi:hypothetical protein
LSFSDKAIITEDATLAGRRVWNMKTVGWQHLRGILRKIGPGSALVLCPVILFSVSALYAN